MTKTKAVLLALMSIASTAGAVPSSPYLGEETRSVKSLSDVEIADLRAGNGAGFAKTAELNGYPGPAHVLELAEGLRLSDAQRDATRILLKRHKASAQELGARVLEAERALEEAFANRSVDEASLSALTATVAKYRGELRAEHLRTHLVQTALLTPDQIERYTKLRGYAAPAEPMTHHHH